MPPPVGARQQRLLRRQPLVDRKVSVGGSVTALVGFVLKWQMDSGVGTELAVIGSLVFLVGILAGENGHRTR